MIKNFGTSVLRQTPMIKDILSRTQFSSLKFLLDYSLNRNLKHLRDPTSLYRKITFEHKGYILP